METINSINKLASVKEVKRKLRTTGDTQLVDTTLKCIVGLQNSDDHVFSYINSLSPINKISLIMYALKNRVPIDNDTFNYESINTICHSIILSMTYNSQ